MTVTLNSNKSTQNHQNLSKIYVSGGKTDSLKIEQAKKVAKEEVLIEVKQKFDSFSKNIQKNAKIFKSFVSGDSNVEMTKGELAAFSHLVNSLDTKEITQLDAEKPYDALKEALLSTKRDLEEFKKILFELNENNKLDENHHKKDQHELHSAATADIIKVIGLKSIAYILTSFNCLAGDPLWEIATGLHLADGLKASVNTDVSHGHGLEHTSHVLHDISSSVGLILTITEGVRFAVKKNAIKKNKQALKELKNELQTLDPKTNGLLRLETTNKIHKLEKKIKAQKNQAKKLKSKFLKTAPITTSYFIGSFVATFGKTKAAGIAGSTFGSIIFGLGATLYGINELRKLNRKSKKMRKEVAALTENMRKLKDKKPEILVAKKAILKLRINNLTEYKSRKYAVEQIEQGCLVGTGVLSMAGGTVAALKTAAVISGASAAAAASATGIGLAILLGGALLVAGGKFIYTHRHTLLKGNSPSLQKLRARKHVKKTYKRVQKLSRKLLCGIVTGADQETLKGLQTNVVEQSEKYKEAAKNLDKVLAKNAQRKLKDHVIGKKCKKLANNSDTFIKTIPNIHKFAAEYCPGLDLHFTDSTDRIKAKVKAWIAA